MLTPDAMPSQRSPADPALQHDPNPVTASSPVTMGNPLPSTGVQRHPSLVNAATRDQRNPRQSIPILPPLTSASPLGFGISSDLLSSPLPVPPSSAPDPIPVAKNYDMSSPLPDSSIATPATSGRSEFVTREQRLAALEAKQRAVRNPVQELEEFCRMPPGTVDLSQLETVIRELASQGNPVPEGPELYAMIGRTVLESVRPQLQETPQPETDLPPSYRSSPSSTAAMLLAAASASPSTAQFSSFHSVPPSATAISLTTSGSASSTRLPGPMPAANTAETSGRSSINIFAMRRAAKENQKKQVAVAEMERRLPESWRESTQSPSGLSSSSFAGPGADTGPLAPSGNMRSRLDLGVQDQMIQQVMGMDSQGKNKSKEKEKDKGKFWQKVKSIGKKTGGQTNLPASVSSVSVRPTQTPSPLGHSANPQIATNVGASASRISLGDPSRNASSVSLDVEPVETIKTSASQSGLSGLKSKFATFGASTMSLASKNKNKGKENVPPGTRALPMPDVPLRRTQSRQAVKSVFPGLTSSSQAVGLGIHGRAARSEIDLRQTSLTARPSTAGADMFARLEPFGATRVSRIAIPAEAGTPELPRPTLPARQSVYAINAEGLPVQNQGLPRSTSRIAFDDTAGARRPSLAPSASSGSRQPSPVPSSVAEPRRPSLAPSDSGRSQQPSPGPSSVNEPRRPSLAPTASNESRRPSTTSILLNPSRRPSTAAPTSVSQQAPGLSTSQSAPLTAPSSLQQSRAVSPTPASSSLAPLRTLGAALPTRSEYSPLDYTGPTSHLAVGLTPSRPSASATGGARTSSSAETPPLSSQNIGLTSSPSSQGNSLAAPQAHLSARTHSPASSRRVGFERSPSATSTHSSQMDPLTHLIALIPTFPTTLGSLEYCVALSMPVMCKVVRLAPDKPTSKFPSLRPSTSGGGTGASSGSFGPFGSGKAKEKEEKQPSMVETIEIQKTPESSPDPNRPPPSPHLEDHTRTYAQLHLFELPAPTPASASPSRPGTAGASGSGPKAFGRPSTGGAFGTPGFGGGGGGFRFGDPNSKAAEVDRRTVTRSTIIDYLPPAPGAHDEPEEGDRKKELPRPKWGFFIRSGKDWKDEVIWEFDIEKREQRGEWLRQVRCYAALYEAEQIGCAKAVRDVLNRGNPKEDVLQPIRDFKAQQKAIRRAARREERALAAATGNTQSETSTSTSSRRGSEAPDAASQARSEGGMGPDAPQQIHGAGANDEGVGGEGNGAEGAIPGRQRERTVTLRDTRALGQPIQSSQEVSMPYQVPAQGVTTNRHTEAEQNQPHTREASNQTIRQGTELLQDDDVSEFSESPYRPRQRGRPAGMAYQKILGLPPSRSGSPGQPRSPPPGLDQQPPTTSERMEVREDLGADTDPDVMSPQSLGALRAFLAGQAEDSFGSLPEIPSSPPSSPLRAGAGDVSENQSFAALHAAPDNQGLAGLGTVIGGSGHEEATGERPITPLSYSDAAGSETDPEDEAELIKLLAQVSPPTALPASTSSSTAIAASTSSSDPFRTPSALSNETPEPGSASTTGGESGRTRSMMSMLNETPTHLVERKSQSSSSGGFTGPLHAGQIISNESEDERAQVKAMKDLLRALGEDEGEGELDSGGRSASGSASVGALSRNRSRSRTPMELMDTSNSTPPPPVPPGRSQQISIDEARRTALHQLDPGSAAATATAAAVPTGHGTQAGSAVSAGYAALGLPSAVSSGHGHGTLEMEVVEEEEERESVVEVQAEEEGEQGGRRGSPVILGETVRQRAMRVRARMLASGATDMAGEFERDEALLVPEIELPPPTQLKKARKIGFDLPKFSAKGKKK